MNNIDNACRSCHPQNANELKAKVSFIQTTTANGLRASENAILALIEDIKAARALLANVPQFKAVADEKEREKQISKVLAKALDAHRKAQMRWDFIFSENSTGFHAPQEAQRVLGQSQELARIGQIEVQSALKPFGLSVTPAIKAKMPKAPNPITPNSIIGAKPPVNLVQFDATYDFFKAPAK